MMRLIILKKRKTEHYYKITFQKRLLFIIMLKKGPLNGRRFEILD